VNDTGYVLAVILGLTSVSVINRSFFFLSQRELRLPHALQRGLRYAPLATQHPGYDPGRHGRSAGAEVRARLVSAAAIG
jgi:hypothetical protein